MTQTKCQHCGGKAQTFLCGKCVDTLRDTLREMPWWLARLTETAVGQTRMTDNGGRRTARRDELKGDKTLAACLEQLPDAKTLEQARHRRQQHALAVALASGGCNARASELLAEVADSLTYWIRVLCEAKGIRSIPRDFIGPLRANEMRALPPGATYGAIAAKWLRHRADSIALSEDAGDIMGDVLNHRRDVERVVNRPVQWIDLGDCPALIDDVPCGRKLRAPAGESTARCRDCRTVHEVNWLRMLQTKGPITWDRLSRGATSAPDPYRVELRTLQRWRKTGILKPHTIDGDGNPLYLWDDLQAIKARTRPGKRLVNA